MGADGPSRDHEQMVERQGKAADQYSSDVAAQDEGHVERKDDRKALLRTQYEEVCRSYHAIDDFRAKLLALLPIGGGAVGVGLILGKNVPPEYLIALGAFGFMVTVGLGIYELHQQGRCRFLKDLAKELECGMGLEDAGLFTREAQLEAKRFRFIGQGAAGWTVYSAAISGWIFIFVTGLRGL
jgi:hypothetical protein